MRIIAVSDVARGELYPELDADESLRSLMAKRVEALGRAPGRLVSCDTQHALAKAAHDAFYEHHPLVLRPDDVWFCVAQGFATHVNQNVEELRERFVRHEGKKKLVVERPDFFLGQDNPWPEAFTAFSDQIGDHVGKLRELVAAEFSTSTPMETAAFEVALMDAFQGYFEYEMRAGCGIPEIHLHGTSEDWRSMIPRLKHLSEYGLEEWVDALVPNVEAIARAAEGEDDRAFWKSFFRYESGSGPAELTGWILTLFPYITVNWQTGELGRNPYLSSWRKGFDTAEARNGFLGFGSSKAQGPGIAAIPQSLVSAPVRFVDVRSNDVTPLRFVAGQLGVTQDETTRALSAMFGWAVVYDET